MLHKRVSEQLFHMVKIIKIELSTAFLIFTKMKNRIGII